MPRSRPEFSYAAILRSAGERAPTIEAKVDFVQSRRRDAEESRQLDEFFLTEITNLRSSLEQVQVLLNELRAKQDKLVEYIEKLQAPPLHEATYLGTVETSGRTLATVFHQGARHLVDIDQESVTEPLAPGDSVFLAHSLGVILAKAKDRRQIGETAAVERCLPQNRLVVRDRDVEVVVDTTDDLREELPGPGDQVLWSRDVGLAFGKISTTESNPHFANIQEVTQQPPRVGGLDGKLEPLISLFTTCLAEPDLARRFGLDEYNHSAMLVGPPGCGKTLTARTIAYQVTQRAGVPCRFASISGSELESPWVGESQRNIRQLFKALNDHDGPTVLYIDEVEAIGRQRGGFASYHSDKFLSQWLTCLDGFKQRDRVAVIAATNRKDLLDPAILERLSGLEVPIGRPSRYGAHEIFQIHLPESLPYRVNGAAQLETRTAAIDAAVSRLFDPNADNEVAVLRFRDGSQRRVAARELISGRLIRQICRAAQHRALARAAGSQREDGGIRVGRDRQDGITVTDIDEAVAEAIDKLSTTLSVHNAIHYLTDLSEEADVVAVDPIRRKVNRHRYLVA
jgi:ATP-dependent 26S proteasome regulatory subunit